MNKTDWENLLKKFRIESGKPDLPPGEPRPVSASDIHKFEDVTHFTLPKSYKDFCEVFGPCTLIYPGSYQIAVPGSVQVAGKFDLIKLNGIVRSYKNEYKEYCNDPVQFERSWFFAYDIATSYYFWDPLCITNVKSNEYKIFAIYRDYKIKFISESFENLVIDIWSKNDRSLNFENFEDDEDLIEWNMILPE